MAKSSGTGSQRGPRGIQGRRGAPGIEPKEIQAIIADIEHIQEEVSVQFKRIAQMQIQIDATLKALKEMGERAGKQQQRKPKRKRA